MEAKPAALTRGRSAYSWGRVGDNKYTTEVQADGTELHTETVDYDGSTFTFTSPKPPHWAKDDKELWDLQRMEIIRHRRAEACKAHWESRTQEKMREIEILQDCFRAFDVDDSGCLETEEVIEILTRVGGGNPMTREDAEEFIKIFDVNGDGKMQLKEYIDAMKAMAGFAGMNTNEDAEEIAEMITDDIGLKVLEAGKIQAIEAHKNTNQAHGETW